MAHNWSKDSRFQTLLGVLKTPKILAQPKKKHGKNKATPFLNVFEVPGSKSEVRISIKKFGSQVIKFDDFVCLQLYSRGQAKPTNLVSQQLMYLQLRFFQVLVPICETCRKTHLRSFSHNKLVQPNFWTQNMQHLRSKTRWRGWNFSKVCTCVGVRSETNQRSQINLFAACSPHFYWDFLVTMCDRQWLITSHLQFGSMFGIFFCENSLMTCFENWWTDASQWKEAIVLFSLFFPALFGCTCQNFRDYFCI